ncbi:MAG: quinol:cytochrome C oxidoreductase [bacterium]|nr:quinol:cytochrome C oxidoreductase [bacterium]
MTRQDLREQDFVLAEGAGRRMGLIGVVLGAIALGASALLALGGGEQATEDFFRSYLHNFMFFLSLALGGMFFVLVMHLTRAGWSVSLRRLAEVMAWTIGPLTLLAVVIVIGMHDLYEWTHELVVAGDSLLQHKRPFLNPVFFVVRLIFYFAVWNFLAQFFLRRSLAQDASRDPRITLQMERVAAPGTIFYAMTVTFAAFDLIMSLYPHWYSTIYGVYYFSGAVLGFFSLVPLAVWFLRRSGRLRETVTTEHHHDMGKLMFAFVVFWAYIAFSQYFLIWYGNVPEETSWYELRQSGPWTSISLVLLLGHFILPFFWLVSRHPKRNPAILVVFACWLLLMHWFDLFYLVMPEARPTGMLFRLTDVTCFVGIGGIVAGAALWRLGRVKLIPVGDPRLDESLGFENV